MDTRRWALFFIFLVCSEHIGSAYGNGGVKPVPKKGCIIESELISAIDGCIDSFKLKVGKQQQVEDLVVKSLKVSDCRCENLHQIKRTACSCVCFKDFIRIFISVSIFDVVFSFVLSLGDGILSGILNVLVEVLQKVVSLLVKVLCLSIELVIVIEGHFNNGKCFVKEISKPKLGKIEIIGIQISGLSNSLGGIVGEILSVVLDLLVTRDFRRALIEAFNELIIHNNWHSCTTPNPPTKPPCHCD